jgi:hypothetical protein
MPQTWEYRVVLTSDIVSLPYGAVPKQTAEIVEQALNRLGKEGWELVWVGQFQTLYLKRQK